jgi:hypothetical protein
MTTTHAPGAEPPESVEDCVSRIRGRPRQDWVDEVRRDQAARWSSGQRVLVEEYLRCCPELTEDEEDTLVLICGEILLRRTTDREVTLEEYQRRFPGLGSQLSVQFELNELWSAAPGEQGRPVVCPVCHNSIQPTDDLVADETVKLWDLATEKPVFEKAGHPGDFMGAAYALAFSPDGQRLALGSDKETISVCDVASGNTLFELRGHEQLASASRKMNDSSPGRESTIMRYGTLPLVRTAANSLRAAGTTRSGFGTRLPADASIRLPILGT